MLGMKDVYSYDAETLQYNGVTTAYESPEEEGVFHIPANATDLKPPVFAPLVKTCRFVGDEWVLADVVKPPSIPLPPEPTPEQLTAVKAIDLSAERDTALSATDWIISRHRDEMALGNTTTLTSAAFIAYLEYRQQLRDITTLEGFPYVDLPVLKVG